MKEKRLQSFVMEDTMKKCNIISIIILSMLSILLVGCKKEETEAVIEIEAEEEENMFGLTESEQKMYAEYAAGVLMRYNAGTNMRVLEGQVLQNQEAKEQAAREQAAKREQLAAEYAANKNDAEKKENESSKGETSDSSQGISYINDMAAATGANSFTITYSGYEITDSYPSSGEDVLMAIDAPRGKLLLVTKFLVSNVSGQTEDFDMFSKQPKFKVNVDGNSYKSQYTLLLDDLSMYKGDVEAGAVMENVLVFEVPESVAANVNNMELTVTVGDKVSTMQLSGGNVTGAETLQSIEPELEDNELMEETSDIVEEEFEQSDEGGNVTVVGSNSN